MGTGPPSRAHSATGPSHCNTVGVTQPHRREQPGANGGDTDRREYYGGPLGRLEAWGTNRETDNGGLGCTLLRGMNWERA